MVSCWMMGPFLYHSWPIFSATPRVSHHKTERFGLTAAARATVVLCICCGFPTVFFLHHFQENNGKTTVFPIILVLTMGIYGILP